METAGKKVEDPVAKWAYMSTSRIEVKHELHRQLALLRHHLRSQCTWETSRDVGRMAQGDRQAPCACVGWAWVETLKNRSVTHHMPETCEAWGVVQTALINHLMVRGSRYDVSRQGAALCNPAILGMLCGNS